MNASDRGSVSTPDYSVRARERMQVILAAGVTLLSGAAVRISRPWMLAITIAVAFPFVIPGQSSGRTWTVNVNGTGDAATAQAAIDSAGPGDVVFLEAGTFHEMINFQGKAITVRGSGRDRTILDASGLDTPCVRFLSRESSDAVLESMTITGGSGQAYGNARIGGGIIIDDAEPTLRDLKIVSNMAFGTTGSYGGGIHVFGRSSTNIAQPLIENCEIALNTARANGGGIGFSGLSAPVIRNCSIHNNKAMFADGGGIWGNAGVGVILIESNSIVENSAGDHGGGIHIGGSITQPLIETTISQNLIARNTADGADSEDITGGGLWLLHLNADINHNTIVFNEALGGGGIVAGGIGLRRSGTYQIEFNIIAFTTHGYAFVCEDGVQQTISNNLGWENARIGRFGCPDWVYLDGNVLMDPLFCEPDMGNFSVQENSPALTQFSSYAGCRPLAGCSGRTTVSSWGAIKARF